MNAGSPPSGFDKADFALWPRGNKYEDFHVDQTFDHHWGRTLTQADSTNFCVATCNWNPLYLNREYATSNGHPDCPIHPALVLCLVIGMSVEDLSETGGPFLGMKDCIFAESVYPGDTLTAHSVVLECRESTSRPDFGIVTWQTHAQNQRGETVLSLVRSNLVAKRPASDADLGVGIQQEVRS